MAAKRSIERKTYRFRLEPTRQQADGLARFAGSRRFVWNWALARRREHHAATGKGIPAAQLSAELTALKAQSQTAWLHEIDSQLLQQALADLNRAYLAFFERRARFPRFKARKRDVERFRIPQRIKLEDGRLYCPKLGWIRLRQSREIGPGETPKSATFKRSATGHWFVTLTVEFELPDLPLPALDSTANVVGIDLGLKTFAVCSDGRLFESPRAYRTQQRKLARAQRAFSRKQKGSANRAKQRAKVARVHERIGAVRNDFLHKTTTTLINDYDLILVEDLCLKGLARTKLAKSFHDAALGEFRRQLEYKARWQRKRVGVIDRWFPSSKLCGTCGLINDALTLNDREWTCAACGTLHDRDLNAARNIEREGLRLYELASHGSQDVAAGQAETLNACGADVRPLATAADGETRLAQAA